MGGGWTCLINNGRKARSPPGLLRGSADRRRCGYILRHATGFVIRDREHVLVVRSDSLAPVVLG